MSSETNLESAELKELEATLVVLPYVEDKYKMVIFHPFPNTTIDDLEQKLFQETSGNIGGYIRRVRRQMTLLRVPKFTVEYEANLAEVLKQLNVTAVFSEAALLTEMTSSPLHVQDILHKTKIIVDEDGSEAAAASGVVLNTRLGRYKYVKCLLNTRTLFLSKAIYLGGQMKEININSPFIFSIYDTENHISLFMGKITNPGGGGEAEAEPLLGLREFAGDYDDYEAAEIEEEEAIVTVCSGGSLQDCVYKVCNFPDVELQKVCILDCEAKC